MKLSSWLTEHLLVLRIAFGRDQLIFVIDYQRRIVWRIRPSGRLGVF
ncbi:MAG: hypothetical protein KIT69_09490 [Propionibacteriaceae bacterium]|nr:hypothetical protein [Propionibacteriaceae bacterium]